MNEPFFLYRNFTDLAGTDGLSVAKVQSIFLRTRRPFVLPAINFRHGWCIDMNSDY